MNSGPAEQRADQEDYIRGGGHDQETAEAAHAALASSRGIDEDRSLRGTWRGAVGRGTWRLLDQATERHRVLGQGIGVTGHR
ncbi:hypothetical protein TR51_10645 [Kitasatospora griseola]|uniref:Uncharacterized protein n=1 Tax=Kitasatospora griseola TaxID=2064 RepID=A0A0D0NZN7_KITGR|nr:hypothetical protein TR51_10645 [Kitasatospora griseola]